jgi:hypothetical protein
MAENNFPTVMKSLMVIMLFIILFVYFAINFAHENNKDTISMEEKIGVQNMTKTFNILAINGTQWYDSFSSQKIFDPFTVAGIVLTGMFNLAQTMFSAIFLPLQMLVSFAENVFGIPEFVTQILVALVTIVVIFGIWRALKTGY